MEMAMKCKMCNGKIKYDNPKWPIKDVNMVIFVPRGSESRPIMPLCDDCYNRVVASAEEIGIPIAHGTVGFDLPQEDDFCSTNPRLVKVGEE